MARRIGAGSFAHVYRGNHKTTNVPVAIKAIDREKMNLNKKHQENLESEISIMKKLQHPNIVKLFDIIVRFACLRIACLCADSWSPAQAVRQLRLAVQLPLVVQRAH